MLVLVKDTHWATVMTTVISTDISRKLYAMNSKLKRDRKNLDIRLPGNAGRLSQMDSRQLELFCESQKHDLEAAASAANSCTSSSKLK